MSAAECNLNGGVTLMTSRCFYHLVSDRGAERLPCSPKKGNSGSPSLRDSDVTLHRDVRVIHLNAFEIYQKERDSFFRQLFHDVTNRVGLTSRRTHTHTSVHI